MTHYKEMNVSDKSQNVFQQFSSQYKFWKKLYSIQNYKNGCKINFCKWTQKYLTHNLLILYYAKTCETSSGNGRLLGGPDTNDLLQLFNP